MWNDLQSVEALGKTAMWLSVVLAFLAGIAGVVRVVASSRAETLTVERKKTPPSFEVQLQRSGRDTLVVLIESKNLIPFECQWKIVTRDNRLVNGIPLDWTKVYPTPQNKLFRVFEHIDLTKVRDNYLEIRFDYRSTYAAEMNLPSLSGKLIRSYRLSEDERSIEPE
jgi:hypothetical protein